RYLGSDTGAEFAAKGRDSLPAVFGDTTLSSADLTPMVGAPAIIRRSGDSFELFYRDDRNRLVHASRSPTGWAQPEILGSLFISHPAAGSCGNEGYYVFALQKDYLLHHYRWDGTSLTTEVVNGFVKGLGPPTVIASPG